MGRIYSYLTIMFFSIFKKWLLTITPLFFATNETFYYTNFTTSGPTRRKSLIKGDLKSHYKCPTFSHG